MHPKKQKVLSKSSSPRRRNPSSVRSFIPSGRFAAISKRRELANEIVERLNECFPDARCELNFSTSFQLLVSVVLSAQATDKIVNRVMESLYRDEFTPQVLLGWGEAKLLEKIRQIGLAPTKAKNLIKLSQILMAEHGGNVPRSRQDLEALPGVGRKTASVILGEIYNEPTLAVDTHVFRVSQRLGLHKESNANKAETELLKVVDPSFLPKAHHLFILHGRRVCASINPHCEHCVLADICPSNK